MEYKLLRFLTAIKEDIQETFVKSIISTLMPDQEVVVGNYYFELDPKNSQVSRLFIDYGINVAQIIPEPKIASVHFEIYNKTFSELEPYFVNIEKFFQKGGIYPNVIFFPIIFAKKDVNNIEGRIIIIIPRIINISSEERPPLPPLPNSNLFPTLSSSDPSMTSEQHRRITEQTATQVISIISSVPSFENPVLIPQEILEEIDFCIYLLLQAILLMNVVLPDVIQKIPELKEFFNDIYIDPNNIDTYKNFYQKIKNPGPPPSRCSNFFLRNFYKFYQIVNKKSSRLFTINNTYYLKLTDSFSKNFYDYFTYKEPKSTDFPDYLIIQTDKTETFLREIDVKPYAISDQSKNYTPVYQYLYGFSDDHDLVIVQDNNYLITTSEKKIITYKYDDKEVNSYIKSLKILIYVMTFRDSTVPLTKA